ncbi:MAG: class I SAM-dependent methyltransferase [Gemmataceae bacterium]|nr:class I SAM-dependent methyltransferase [Gemmataceae bacterium]
MMPTTTTAPAPSGTSYDEVPYTSHPFPQTHPDRLATVATLMGLRPVPVERCRVLELGCASGGNLIPMAVTLPESRFVGLDLSVIQIERGRRQAEALGVTNVELLSRNLLDVGPELGQFDYVICHGVYSWVPPAIRDKILSICSQNLAPDGVAYVSYNTYPGWHMRGMIRDMMAYHAQRFRASKRKVSQARALLDFLAESVSTKDGPYALLLKQELEVVRSKPDDYLLHEHLEEFNDPVYFYQFVKSATAHGLTYLGEAALGTMSTEPFAPKVREALHRVAQDQIQREQYMDFLRNRMFRQTLLCHASQRFTYAVEGGRVAGLHVASRALPTAQADLASDSADEFKLQEGCGITTRDCLLKAALLELAPLWPGSLPFSSLLERARERLRAAGGKVPEDQPSDAGRLGASLVYAYLPGLVELSPRPPQFTLALSERPVACRLARLQAEAGNLVTNRRHERVTLGDSERQLLMRLDGTRDRPALAEALATLCLTGTLTARHEGLPVREAEQVWTTVNNAIPGMMTRLARLALLVG